MTFAELLDRFKGTRALVVGDLMLDEYLFCRATRISPEAPVMVVRHDRTSRVPGGAANVARNLAALGAETLLVGVIGCDDAAAILETTLFEQGFADVALVRDEDRATTRKTRVLAANRHQVLRIDHEDDRPTSEETQSRVLSEVLRAIGKSDVIVLSDYLKGTLATPVVREVVGMAKAAGKPVVANPKPRSLSAYQGASLISLNRAEASEALGLHEGMGDSDVAAEAERLRALANSDAVLITLGEAGMVAHGLESLSVRAPKVEVYDTAGAGDTVVATVAMGLAAAGFRREVFELAAHTASSVVRHVGVAVPSVEDLEAIKGVQNSALPGTR